MTEAEANALIEAATKNIVESTIRIWERQIRFLASEVSPEASGVEALLAVADAMRLQTDRGTLQ